MKTGLIAIAALLLLAATPAFAHRLDELLQSTIITLEKDHVTLQMRLTPGVQVFPAVLAGIDTDGDGVISETERQAYVERVIRDLSLTVDGGRLPLRLVASIFPTVEEMREGVGDIRLDLETDVPPGGAARRLIFENRHESGIAAYLVNCFVPRDPGIRITAQSRDYRQSSYQIDYTQASTAPALPVSGARSSTRSWLAAGALMLLGCLALLKKRTGSARPIPGLD